MEDLTSRPVILSTVLDEKPTRAALLIISLLPDPHSQPRAGWPDKIVMPKTGKARHQREDS